MSGADVQVVLVTAPNVEVARFLARSLVESRLAACVNVVPAIRSLYRWEGEVQEDEEVLLVVKTRADRGDALTSRICDLHPYDVPEVLALPAVGGSEPYLRWLREESQP